MVAVAVVVAFGWDTRVSAALTRDLGGYAAALQAAERSFAGGRVLRPAASTGRLVLSREILGEDLPVGAHAPESTGITRWFNTPAGRR